MNRFDDLERFPLAGIALCTAITLSGCGGESKPLAYTAGGQDAAGGAGGATADQGGAPADTADAADGLPALVDPADPFGPAGRVTSLKLPSSAEDAENSGCDVLGLKGGAGLAAIGRFVGEGGLQEVVTEAADGSIGLVLLFQLAGFGHRADDPSAPVELRAFYGDLATEPGAFSVDPTSVDAEGLSQIRWPETSLSAEGALRTQPRTFTLTLPLGPEVPPVDLILEQALVRGQAVADGVGVRLADAHLEGYLTRDSLLTLIGDFKEACQLQPPPSFCAGLSTFLNPTAPPEMTLNVLLALVGGFDAGLDASGPRMCTAQARDCNAIGVCLPLETTGVRVTGLTPAMP